MSEHFRKLNLGGVRSLDSATAMITPMDGGKTGSDNFGGC